MKRYIAQRLVYMVFLLWMVSIVTFVVIQLPPGDYLSTYISRLEQAGEELSEEQVESLREQYGLNLPLHLRYFKWITQVVRGEFGFSYDWQRPVRDLIGERLALTFTIAILSAAFTYAVAIPIGIYSATHQYSNRRLCRLNHRLHRAGHPQFHAGADHALYRLDAIRPQPDASLLATVRRRALEPGEAGRSGDSLAHPDHRRGHGWHGPA